MASLDRTDTRRLALRGVLVAAAMVLSWVEAQIPAFFAVPGMKLGLTNAVVLTALYLLSGRDAMVINLVRILLVGFTFGSVSAMLYSLAGGLLSGAVMIVLKRFGPFGPVGVSVAGGISHNIGQIAVAVAVLGSHYVLYYLPLLWLSGLAAGTLIGLLCGSLLRRIPAAAVRTARTEGRRKEKEEK